MDSDLWKVTMELNLNTQFLIFLLGLTPTAPPPSPILSHEEGESSAYKPWKAEVAFTENDSWGWESQTQVKMKPGSVTARRVITYSNKVNEEVNTIHIFSLLPPLPTPTPTVSITLRKLWPEYVVAKCLQFQTRFYQKHQSCYWSLIYLEQRTLNLLKYRIWMLIIKMNKRIQK